VEFYAQVYRLIQAWYAEPTMPVSVPAGSVSNRTDWSR
jgi:hypothetical protein